MSGSDGQYSIGNALTGMAQMGQMGIQNALNRQQMTQNNLLIQNTLAKRAAGADFQKAIDPTTGQLSPTKYNQLLAADPQATFAAAPSSQAGLGNQTTQLDNQAHQITNKAAQLGFLANTATGYAENPPTLKQMQSDLADGVAQGLYDPSVAAGILAKSPDPTEDPQGFKSFWTNEAQHLSAAHGEVARFLPSATPINAGGQTIMGQANPLAPGYTAPGSVVTSTPNPEFMSTPQTVVAPNGNSVTGTPAQLGIPIPKASIAPPGNPVAGPGGALPPGYGPQGLTPIGPAAGAPSAVAPTPTASPSAAVPNNGGIMANGPMVVAPGTVAAGATLAADQTNQFQNDVTMANNTAPDIANAYEIGAAIKGGAFTGAGSDEKEYLGKLASMVNISYDANSTTESQILDKASGMLQTSNLSGMGAGTDAKLLAAQGITPNKKMTAAAGLATVAMTLGNRLYQQRLGQAAQAWQQNGGSPSDVQNGYNAFKAQFQQNTSPLIMALPFMAPDQLKGIQSFVHSLPVAQQQQFNEQYRASQQAGYLNAPSQ